MVIAELAEGFFVLRAQEGRSWRNKEDLVLEPRMRKGFFFSFPFFFFLFKKRAGGEGGLLKRESGPVG